MRKLSEAELLTLTALLEMEKDGLVVQRAINELISDSDLKRQGESGELAAEGRIKAIQQFINENNIMNTGEV